MFCVKLYNTPKSDKLLILSTIVCRRIQILKTSNLGTE